MNDIPATIVTARPSAKAQVKPPVRVADRHQFDCLIDARSPAEFALDHIPGAINCPTLDDEQRHIVGTLHKQQSAFAAKRVGGAMVADNLAKHLREQFADKPIGWKPLVYCWRGGMRSGSMVTWLRLVGWDAQQLHGGYKTWRRYVIDYLDSHCPALQLRVLLGATGSAKTRILQSMARLGCQVLDLEELAVHKGSVLGSVPGQPQPSQTAFETRIASALEAFDHTQPIYVEGESRKIGRLTVPAPLITRMRQSRCIEVNATPAARLAYLLRDYHYVGDDAAQLVTNMGLLKDLQSSETIARWQTWANAGDLESLFAELMALHYDPLYTRSQNRNYVAWGGRQTVATDDLTDVGIEGVARAVVALACQAQASN